MDSLVSLLDEPHRTLVTGIWAELERRFGLRGIYALRLPHFSYHVADHYASGQLESALADISRRFAPFRLRTTGLGAFTGKKPVLYVPVVPVPALIRLHDTLWGPATAAGSGTVEVYGSETWIPHITLAHGDLLPDLLPDVMRYLLEHDYDWEFKVDSIVVVADAGSAHQRHMRYPLLGL